MGRESYIYRLVFFFKSLNYFVYIYIYIYVYIYIHIYTHVFLFVSKLITCH